MFRPTEAEVVLPPLGAHSPYLFFCMHVQIFVGGFMFRPTEAEVVLPPLGGS